VRECSQKLYSCRYDIGHIHLQVASGILESIQGKLHVRTKRRCNKPLLFSFSPKNLSN